MEVDPSQLQSASRRRLSMLSRMNAYERLKDTGKCKGYVDLEMVYV